MINEYSKERVFVRRYRIILLNAISEKLTQRKSFLSRRITNCSQQYRITCIVTDAYRSVINIIARCCCERDIKKTHDCVNEKFLHWFNT